MFQNVLKRSINTPVHYLTEEFIEDDKTTDAVIRNLEIIGQAVNKIPKEIKDAHKEIEWKKIIGLRNRVIHDYFGVDLEIIWYIIVNELDGLKEKFIKSFY